MRMKGGVVSIEHGAYCQIRDELTALTDLSMQDATSTLLKTRFDYIENEEELRAHFDVLYHICRKTGF